MVAAHRALAERAIALGHELTDDPALMLEADGMALPLHETETGTWRARLPSGAATLRTLSRSAVACEVDAAVPNRRRLGVALAWVRRDGTAQALHGPGFHACEGDAAWCWTNGAAELRLSPLDRPSTVEIALHARWLRYPLRPTRVGSEHSRLRA